MPESPLPFHVRKIGHVVLNVSDLEAATRFYTGLLGLQVSDRYNESMVPGGMVFLRCNTDHHGGAPVVRSPSSSRIRTATTSRSTGAWTRSAPAVTCDRRASGARP